MPLAFALAHLREFWRRFKASGARLMMRCLSVPCTVWLIVAALTEVFGWMWPIGDQLSQNTYRLPAHLA
jgi:hypothetical protein